MANDINRLIDMIYERIEDAKAPALKPNMSMVDRDEMLDLLDELRAQLPVEIKRAQELLAAREKFDLIFLDPPYEAGLLEPALAHIARFDILAPHGIIVAEHPAGRTTPALAPPYRVHRTYRYGKIALTVYHRDANQVSEEKIP